MPGRVLYDSQNYKAIQNTLLDPDQYNKINGLTRVRFVSDIFALAEGAILSYEYVFDTVMYLKHETMLAPWKVAVKELDRIRSRLLGSDIFHKYQVSARCSSSFRIYMCGYCIIIHSYPLFFYLYFFLSKN